VTGRFTDRLRAAADALWKAQHAHPFVRGIGDGSLDGQRFAYWVRQDFQFLVEYCRLLALAAARAPDLETLVRFAELLRSTAVTEMSLHRALAAEMGISDADLRGEPMAPTTRAYADFLLRTAAVGDYAELCAALLPCMWAFSEIGLELAAGRRPADTRLAAWIDSYADPGFAELAAWCRDLVDRLAEGAAPGARAAMEAAFITSSRYELAFWEMAWVRERWPEPGEI
jgi:thiaminase/transcriptional activator TenA